MRSLVELAGVTCLGDWDLLAALTGGRAREETPAQLAPRIGGDVGEVAAGLERLEAAGLVASVGQADGVPLYRATRPERAARGEAVEALLRLVGVAGGRGLLAEGFRAGGPAVEAAGDG